MQHYLNGRVGEHRVGVQFDQVSHFVLVGSVGEVSTVDVDAQLTLLLDGERGLSIVRDEGGRVTLSWLPRIVHYNMDLDEIDVALCEI